MHTACLHTHTACLPTQGGGEGSRGGREQGGKGTLLACLPTHGGGHSACLPVLWWDRSYRSPNGDSVVQKPR